MPRTRLDATGRRRNIRACVPCQNAKRRCSNGLPCSYCIKRNRVSSCIYTNDKQNRSSTRTSQASVIECPPASSVSSQSYPRAPDNPALSPPQPSLREEGSEQSQTLIQSCFPGDSPETTILIQPLLLRNSKGNDVYIGNTAVIGFLPLVRDIFRREMGPSKFTDAATGNTMLETELQSGDISDLRDQTDLLQRKELVRLFFAATSGILDLFEASHILQSLDAVDAGENIENSQYTLINLVIAVGARCHPDSQAYTPCERVHLNRSRQATNIDLLENLNLDTVQICLLMAFYMLCACRRNTAYMYLGVAARAAHAIGLHHEEPFGPLAKENHRRRRTWKSLHVLDSQVSSFLGRPSATSRHRDGLTPYIKSPEDMDISISPGLDATYRLLRIMDDVTTDLDRQQLTYTTSANILLEKLAKWSTNLPTLQSASSQRMPRMLDQELVLGNMHAACSYYFAVMQTTRPFLIHHLLSNTSKGTGGQGGSVQLPPSAVAPTDFSCGFEIVELAKTCEDAAVFMLEGCQEVLQAGFILDNMCLLQAWSFAAALILGLVMFMTEEPNIQIRKSFDGAMAVLQKLSTRSQQSERYLEILSDLINEADKRQQQIAALKREASSRLVLRIFRLDRQNENGFDNSTQSGSEVESTMVNEGEPLSVWPTDFGGPAYIGWENSGFQSWDDFSWLGEPNNQMNA